MKNDAAALAQFPQQVRSSCLSQPQCTGTQGGWKQSQMDSPQLAARIQQAREGQKPRPAAPHSPLTSPALSPQSPPGMSLAPKGFTYPLLESTLLSTAGGSLVRLLHAAHRLQPLRKGPSGEAVGPEGELLLAASGTLCGSGVGRKTCVREAGRATLSEKQPCTPEHLGIVCSRQL